MPTGYQIDDQDGLYFLTFQVINWIDIFSRRNYREIVLDSFSHCRQNKGLQLWAYVIMTNHVHVIMSSSESNLSDIIRDFKRHTARQILKAIHSRKESRRKWMLRQFAAAAKKHKRNIRYQFWTHENHAIILYSLRFIRQKIGYIHGNPVKAGFVEKAEDWLYSSQRNYSGLPALIEIDVLA